MDKKMRLIFLATFLVALCPATAPGTGVQIVINIQGCPLEITRYTATALLESRFIEPISKTGDGGPNGIKHNVNWKHNGEKKYIAFQIAFVNFNFWDEFIDITRITHPHALGPGYRDTGTWQILKPHQYNVFTSFAFIDRIRFNDGHIWQADYDQVATAILKTFPNFEPKELHPISR